MKVFLDTNVVVSAVAARGLCADLMRLVLAQHELLTGEVVLVEVRRVLAGRFAVPVPTVDQLESLLRDQTVIATPLAPSPLVSDDPDDAWVLATAIAGGADLLVTGDQDLLRVAAQAPISIVTPRAAWQRLRVGMG